MSARALIIAVGLLSAAPLYQATAFQAAPGAGAPTPGMQRCTGGYQPPMPRGNPGSWVTADDYPSSAMRGGIEGQVGVVISVGTDGRAIDVEVTQRSASPALDNATITTVMRRARFLPALRNCQPVVGEYTTVIRWAIPRD